MSYEPAQPAPGVESFVYQNLSITEGEKLPPVDLSIFEGGGSRLRPFQPGAGVAEAERKGREANAYQQGMAAGRAEMERVAEEVKASLMANLKKFEQEREQYYRRVEGEVVELALAVAKKVIYREAQVDRVVLAGVVRVALEKIAGSGQIALHTHPSAAQAWRDYMASHSDLATIPEIVEDTTLRPEQLVLKTNHGSTDLGLDAQFAEIEKGFSDLVQQTQRSLKP